MDAAGHDVRVAQVREWLVARAGHDLSVTVHTGSTVVTIAAGPFLGMEEHPVSKGVFRALFSDARRASIDPDEEKFISFGAELQAVEALPGRLVLDKGVQRIEIVDLAEVGPARSDEVSWPSRTHAPAAPAASNAPVPPPPLPSVAPQPAEQVMPPAQPVMPPAAAPAATGPVFEARAKASVYGNSMGSGFFGPVNVRIEQGWMSVTGMRSSQRGVGIVIGTALWVIGAIAALFGLIVAANATGDSDMGFAFCLMGFGLLLILCGLALYFVGRARFMRGEMSTLQFPLINASGRKVRYDDNLGCLLMLFATPVIGLIVMFAMGKRIVRMSVPNDRAVGASRQMLVLKVASSAEGAALDAALRQ